MSVSGINQAITLKTTVKDDGSVSLNIAPKLQGFARLPRNPLALCISFLSLDSIFSLAKTDTQSRKIALSVFENLRQYSIDLESDSCSRLLTGCWNMIRADRMDKHTNYKGPKEDRPAAPRAPLLPITRVAIKQNVIVLQTATDDRYGLHYLEPKQLQSFDAELGRPTRTRKICAANDLMRQAFDFPAHLSFDITLPVSLHPISIHDCYAGKAIIVEDSIYYRIERVINFKNSPQDARPDPADTFSARFQLIAREAPSQEERDALFGPKVMTLKQLTDEMTQAINTTSTEVPELIASANLEGRGGLQFKGKSDFELRVKELTLRNVLTKLGAGPRYSHFPAWMGGETIVHDAAPEQAPAAKEQGSHCVIQ